MWSFVPPIHSSSCRPHRRAAVRKFYNATYPNDYKKRHELYREVNDPNDDGYMLQYVRGIQLWNDWNVQTRNWASGHDGQTTTTSVGGNNGNGSSGSKLDYMMVRMEDFIGATGPDRRYDAIRALADFVGSPRDLQELCQVSRTKPRDLGQSSHVSHRSDGFFVNRGKKTLKGGGRGKPHPPHLLRDQLFANYDVDRNDIKTNEKEIFDIIRNRHPKMNKNKNQKGIDDGNHNPGGEFAYHSRRRRRLTGAEKGGDDGGDGRHRRKNVDGTRGRHEGAKFGGNDVRQRYGKWGQVLANNTRLSECFYREGADGLNMFGYHPYREIPYYFDGERAPVETLSASCTDEMVSQAVS